MRISDWSSDVCSSDLDGVDYHWWDLAKAAGLSTLLSVGAELATNDDDRLISAIRNGGQDTINDAGQQIVRRQLNIAPTLTIRPGFPVRVIVTRDLVLSPYEIGRRSCRARVCQDMSIPVVGV